MPSFQLSYLADQDIVEILEYTLDRWGAEQAVQYATLLDEHFESIGSGTMLSKQLFPHRGDLYVSRCQKHTIFHLERDGQQPLVLAVLHSRMDLINRLEERLAALGI